MLLPSGPLASTLVWSFWKEHHLTAGVSCSENSSVMAGDVDNSPIIEKILALRQEKAALLGFENFAQLSMASKVGCAAVRGKHSPTSKPKMA